MGTQTTKGPGRRPLVEGEDTKLLKVWLPESQKDWLTDEVAGGSLSGRVRELITAYQETPPEVRQWLEKRAQELDVPLWKLLAQATIRFMAEELQNELREK